MAKCGGKKGGKKKGGKRKGCGGGRYLAEVSKSDLKRLVFN